MLTSIMHGFYQSANRNLYFIVNQKWLLLKDEVIMLNWTSEVISVSIVASCETCEMPKLKVNFLYIMELVLLLYSLLFTTRVEETTRQINKQKRKENLTKVQNTLHRCNIIYTLKTLSLSYKSQLWTTHCEQRTTFVYHGLGSSTSWEIFSLFFYEGAWERDWKIFLTIFYNIYLFLEAL